MRYGCSLLTQESATQDAVLTGIFRATDDTATPPTSGGKKDFNSRNQASLVAAIQRGDAAAEEELYHILDRGVRFKLWRQMPPFEADDRVHDIYIIVLQAIRQGRLREPERLLGFIWTVAHRQVAAYIDVTVQARERFEFLDRSWNWPEVPIKDDPGDHVFLQEKKEILAAALGKLPERDREVLRRFYLQHQNAAQICGAMDLTDTQFRLLKYRAKANFGAVGRKALRKPLPMPVAREETPGSRENHNSSYIPPVRRAAAAG
jgi:RNA polymerase sigma-70 factor (ECF subfamily)